MRNVALIICLLLAACATPEEIAAQRQAQLQADHDTCAGYGFRPNSDGFRNCLLQIDIARQQRYQQQYYYHHHPRFQYGYGFRHYL